MAMSMSRLPLSMRGMWRTFPLALLVVLSACGGLAEEPKTVSTLRPSELTAIAPLPSETAPVVSTTESTTANSATVTAQPTITPVRTQSAAQASTSAATGPATQAANVVQGTVSGSVTNGTSGASVPSNLAVMLHMIDAQGQENTLDTAVDSRGSYTFKDVPIRPELGYWTMATYTDRLFGSAYVQGDPGSPAISLPLEIYDVTTNPDVIRINSMTTRVNVTAEGLQIAQITQFTNTSDRVYSSASALDKNIYGSVAVTIPRGASILGFSDNEQRYSISADGTVITDTQPVPPGDSHSIHVIYSLPYRDGMIIEQPVNYPVDGTVRLMVSPADTIRASSQQMYSLGPQTQDDTSVNAYSGKLSLAAGETLRYQLTGTVAATTRVTGQGNMFSRELLMGVLIGAGFGIVVVGLFFLVRERLTGKHKETPSDHQQQVDILVEQLAMLDDQHTNGIISHAAYTRRRERLKLHLAKLMEE